MALWLKLQNIRNSVDFKLREAFSFSLPLSEKAKTPLIDRKIQTEISDFLESFDWQKLLSLFSGQIELSVIDIGARNFCFAPVMDTIFKNCYYDAHLHGIEIDAHRRLKNFHTRKDYGEFYARQVRKGTFHAIDYLDWKSPVDIAFLLNPFVSEEPLLSWGLPHKALQPEKIFRHTYELLKPKKGLCLLSSPSPEEFEIAYELAKKVGFKTGETALWKSKPDSVQQKSRYGIILFSDLR